MGGGVGESVKIDLGRKYTPLYEKGIKKEQNKSMETTTYVTLLMIFEKNYLLKSILSTTSWKSMYDRRPSITPDGILSISSNMKTDSEHRLTLPRTQS